MKTCAVVAHVFFLYFNELRKIRNEIAFGNFTTKKSFLMIISVNLLDKLFCTIE